MNKIDLHIHSSLSDGSLSAEEIVKRAHSNNCQIISITDHDDIDIYPYLQDKYNIEIIPGIEFNSSVRNMHILGYAMNDISEIKRVTDNLRLLNEKICFEVIEKLRQDGFDISVDQVLKYIYSIGLNNDIIDKRKIVKYLIYKNYATGVFDAYNRLIGVGQKYYVPNHKLSPKEIISLINNSDGLPVLAHPKSLKLNLVDLKEQISVLQGYGLKGIEVKNTKMGQLDIEYYRQLIKDTNLLETIGSDFHNPLEDEIGISVDDKFYNNIVKKLVRTRKK